jgi:hypothetical protein
MPTYEYEILDGQGRPTGERFEVFAKMRDAPLTVSPDGRPCRRAVVVPAAMRMGKAKRRERAYFTGAHRAAKGGGGVYNPRQANPHVSLSMPYDTRQGVIVTENGHKVRKHADGTLTTYNPTKPSEDMRPIVRNESDRAKFCERFKMRHEKE